MEDLGVAKEVIPYLGAVFLSEDEFRVFRTGRLGINWDEVERRTERIFRDLQHVSRNGDGFHESWIGVNGNGA
jgi:hypothetical protein